MLSKSSSSAAALRAVQERGYVKMLAVGAPLVMLAGLGFQVIPITTTVTLLMSVAILMFFKKLTHFLDEKLDARAAAREKAAVRTFITADDIGRVLAKLEGDQLLLSGVRCQFGLINYVLLSRQYGVCLVEIKSATGRLAVVDSRIRINGQLPETDYISETLRSTYWLVEELQALVGVKVPVTSLIVFTGAQLEGSRTIKGVTLTNKRLLGESIRDQAIPMADALWSARGKVADWLEAHPAVRFAQR